MRQGQRLRVLALAGGVGGAKLADGLSRQLGDRLTVLVNTGDDFEHMGLHVSPDLDTVMYTLAGIANPETGWGLAGETWNFIEQARRLGGPDWFLLGDRDLATHVLRTERLRRGNTLTAITLDLCEALGISSKILPMTDDRVRTRVHSAGRVLDFQHYFVREKCAVPVDKLSFDGAAEARFNVALDELEQGGDPVAVVICPSNPYLSIAPMLALPGLNDWIKRVPVVRIAVSPIIGGQAVKGPAAKIMRELGIPPSAQSIALHYYDLIDGLVFDEVDRNLAGVISEQGIPFLCTQTYMRNAQDRVALAKDCLAFVDSLLAQAIA
jgi:LPPG:FO 2-phospho-L-lactate transferase